MTLKREVRSLLNKGSPENEAQILSQLVALQIRSAEDLSLISTLIVDKALGDPFYSEVYVRCIEQLCEKQAELPVAQQACGDEGGLGDTAAGERFALEEEFQGCGAFKGLVLQCCSRVFHHFFGDV